MECLAVRRVDSGWCLNRRGRAVEPGWAMRWDRVADFAIARERIGFAAACAVDCLAGCFAGWTLDPIAETGLWMSLAVGSGIGVEFAELRRAAAVAVNLRGLANFR